MANQIDDDNGDCRLEKVLIGLANDLRNHLRDIDSKLDFLIREIRLWMANHRHNGNGTHFPYD